MATGRVPTTANSPLTAKGDLFGYSTTQARVAVGSDGETLVADSSQSVGLRYNPQNALANPVINGGYDIWQRGTTFTIGTNTYAADRWIYYRGAYAAGMTVSRQLVNDSTNLPNIQYCARVQRDSGNTGTQTINGNYSFETTNSIPFAGKTVTFSFYARKGADFSQGSSHLTFQLWSGTGTDQNIATVAYTGAIAQINTTATLTTTWQRFAATATMPTNMTEMAIAFAYSPSGTAGAADYYEITGVQIDLGTYTSSTAPTFRRSGGTLAGELAACQRYYWRTTGQSATANDLMTGWANSTTSAVGVLRFPVTMRGAATGNFGAAGDFGFTWSAGTSTITGAAIDRISAESLNLRLTTTGLTTGQGGAIFLNSGTTKWIEASAEL